MAKEEAPREDLLRDATAYRQRLLLHLPGEIEPVFIGFRATGDVSFYFGEDPVYHFLASGELRRAYLDGQLLKADHGRLAILRRHRTASEVQLLRTNLTDEATTALLARIASDLQKLRAALSQDHYTWAGQAPEDADLIGQLQRWLDEHKQISIAQRPNAG